jgi:5-methylcytosine-specific restriction endonuclease McrA
MTYIVFLAILAALVSFQGLSISTVLAALVIQLLVVSGRHWVATRIRHQRSNTSEYGAPNEIGGYSSFLGNGEWTRLRSAALRNAGYVCSNCGEPDYLHVHHIKPLSLGGQNALDNLRVLCADCHSEAHGFEFTGSGRTDPEYGSRANIRDPKVKALVRAIDESTSVRFGYTRADGQTSVRHALPLDVNLGRRNRIYLKAYDHRRRAERNFRVSRIKDIESR